MSDYNDKSHDAMFSTILTRLDQQDSASTLHRTEMKEFMGTMKDSLGSNGNRISALEREQWTQRGFVAAISLGASAAWHWVKNK